MPGDAELYFVEDYRAARRAFIAAVEAAGGDAISRVHPAKGPDAKPLFTDSAAFGPRHAGRGLLLVSARAAGSAVLTGLLGEGVTPRDARVVFIHALEPLGFATGAPDPDWPLLALAAIAQEELARCQALAVLDYCGPPHGPRQKALAAALPGAAIKYEALAGARERLDLL